MAKKFYAVLKGRGKVPAIYETWKECEEHVKGYPGAQYKSFGDYDQALAYIGQKPEEEKKEGILQAYVDGSFNDRAANYSYGIVLIKDGEVIKTLSGKGTDKEAAKMRQIYGEIEGAMRAADLAIRMGESELELLYDYAGIEKWATGEWQRNNPHTQEYHDIMQKKMRKLKVHFTKVPAHSGDRFNDMADELAKAALR